MKILFVTSELAGLAKAGGLADVSLALPRALKRRGLDVRVLLPGYPSVLAGARALSVVGALPGRAEIDPCLIGETELEDGLKIYAVLAPALFHRPGTPYLDGAAEPFADNDLRFARLGLAAAQIAAGSPQIPWRPDLVHVNDWPSGLAPAYMAADGVGVPTLATIHNIAHQGLFSPARLDALGLPAWCFATDGLEFYGHLSFLKSALHYAAHVTTVSPTYGRQICTQDDGWGLHGLLADRAARGRLTGIVNGLDETCDPASDPYLTYHFDAADPSGKRLNAEFVRQGLCLANSRGPLFAITSRLVHQKGLDLVAAVTPHIVEAGGQVAILGIGEPEIEVMMLDLARRFRGHVGLMVGFNEVMAHRIVAGSDFYLMPSRFEPCGLTQLHAQRCGSLPIAHATGGLVDTIADGETGFLFHDFGLAGIHEAVGRALDLWQRPDAHAAVRRAAMSLDLGWSRPAEAYAGLYATLTGLALPAMPPTRLDAAGRSQSKDPATTPDIGPRDIATGTRRHTA